MANNKVSVLIAARNEPYLQKTITDAFDKAKGEVEVIAVLDGYRPSIEDHKNQILIYHPEWIGQRQSINQAAKLATGKYIFKVDAHCIFDEGYDVKLAAECQYDWTVIPRRHGVIEDGWKPRITNVDYMRLTSPLEPGDLGLRAVAWKDYKKRTDGEMIDDVMTCQGSGWFLRKDRFWDLEGLDEGHGHWGALGCEIGCKAWLSGGALKVNKKTWYAHWQRGRRHTKSSDLVDRKREYYLPRETVRKAHGYARDLWLNNKWHLQRLEFKWLLDKFAPVPGWQEGYPELHN
jgi:glycosyltransferase involved in cell wall biosynthesis